MAARAASTAAPTVASEIDGGGGEVGSDTGPKLNANEQGGRSELAGNALSREAPGESGQRQVDREIDHQRDHE